MTDDTQPKSWLQTLPGILTALATLIGAITGLVVALHGSGPAADAAASAPAPGSASAPTASAAPATASTTAEPTPAPPTSAPTASQPAPSSPAPSNAGASTPSGAAASEPSTPSTAPAGTSAGRDLSVRRPVLALCPTPLVPRRVVPADLVCVSRASRAAVEQENREADQHRQSGGGAFGPDTCRPGYVWRSAVPGDTVCVTPERRAAVRQENQAGRHP